MARQTRPSGGPRPVRRRPASSAGLRPSALGHLAEVEAALGAHEAAIARLNALAVTSDHPEYAATLARVLTDVGQPLQAAHWRSSAAARNDQLVARHPEAFADHVGDFWRT